MVYKLMMTIFPCFCMSTTSTLTCDNSNLKDKDKEIKKLENTVPCTSSTQEEQAIDEKEGKMELNLTRPLYKQRGVSFEEDVSFASLHGREDNENQHEYDNDDGTDINSIIVTSDHYDDITDDIAEDDVYSLFSPFTCSDCGSSRCVCSNTAVYLLERESDGMSTDYDHNEAEGYQYESIESILYRSLAKDDVSTFTWLLLSKPELKFCSKLNNNATWLHVSAAAGNLPIVEVSFHSSWQLLSFLSFESVFSTQTNLTHSTLNQVFDKFS